MHQIISQRKDDNDLDIDDAKAADVAAGGNAVAPSSRRSRAKTSRMSTAASSNSLISSASNSRLTAAASTDSLISTYSLTNPPSTDSLMPASRLSTVASGSSLMSTSRLHTTPSMESLMSEMSRASVDTRKFDFSAGMADPTQFSSPVSDPMMSDISLPACDRVKFTTGHSMEFLMPDITSGGTVEKKPLVPETDLMFGRTDVMVPKTEDWISKNADRRFENMETKMMKDEVMTSELDTKISSAAAPLSQASTDVRVSTEMKLELDKPITTGDVVAVSNVTSLSSSSAAAAVSSAATTGASEMTPIASASDLKKEAQAISYDWVSCQSLRHICFHFALQR